MLRVIFMLECDCCSSLLNHMSASSSIDEDEWLSWAYEIPLYAQRFCGWQLEGQIHTCPGCRDDDYEPDDSAEFAPL